MNLERLAASRANYWIGLGLDLLVSLALIVAGGIAGGLGPAPLVAFAAGWLTFTLLEYAMHRWVYHGPRSPFRRVHGRHHRDDTLFGAPFFFTLAVTAILFGIARLVAPAPAAAVFAGTILLAYACQSIVHHLVHGWPGSWRLRPDGVLGRLRRHHMIHHHSEQPVNYGVSTRLWDRVFGTIETRAGRR